MYQLCRILEHVVDDFDDTPLSQHYLIPHGHELFGYSRSNLCKGDGIISVCQDVANNDLQGFKGILMRYAGLYVNEFDDADYKEWMIRNAMHAYCNQNSRDFGHTAWLVKANEDLQQDGKDYGGRPFGASTSIPAAYGVRLNDLYVVTGDATTLEAEDGTLSGNAEIRTDANTGRQFVGNLDNGAGYVRLAFQSSAASDYLVDVYYVSAQNRDLQITAGTKRVSVSCPSVGTWDDLSREGKVSVQVNMRAGNVNIMLTNPNGNAPNIDKLVITPIATTKENNTLTADKAEREGDSKMVFTYRAAKAGHYQARVSYRTDATARCTSTSTAPDDSRSPSTTPTATSTCDRCSSPSARATTPLSWATPRPRCPR